MNPAQPVVALPPSPPPPHTDSQQCCVTRFGCNGPSNRYCGSGSRIRCLFDPWIRDAGWVKYRQDQDPGRKNPDHISGSLEQFFWLKILKFFDADPEWKKLKSRKENIWIREKHPTSTTLLQTVIRKKPKKKIVFDGT